MTAIIAFIIKVLLILGGLGTILLGLFAEGMKTTPGVGRPMWRGPLIAGLIMIILGVFWILFP